MMDVSDIEWNSSDNDKVNSDSESSTSSSSDSDKEGARKSERVKEFEPEQAFVARNPSSVTILHHPPPGTTKKKEEPMSFQEYLSYDKAQQAIVDQAKQERK